MALSNLASISFFSYHSASINTIHSGFINSIVVCSYMYNHRAGLFAIEWLHIKALHIINVETWETSSFHQATSAQFSPSIKVCLFIITFVLSAGLTVFLNFRASFNMFIEFLRPHDPSSEFRFIDLSSNAYRSVV